MARQNTFPLRIPEDMRAVIGKRAEERMRSINNEILILLKLGLVNETEESKALKTADQLISQTKKTR